MDTIFAQSSAPGKAGVSVFRISGHNALEASQRLTGACVLTHRTFYLKSIYSGSELIDNAMVVYFQAPHSFTGEDVVEIHVHGSLAIGNMLTEALLATRLLRIATPGEFAKRAFLNNKMDLTRAEGLADLIDAETAMQHKQAIRQMSGELEKLYDSWRKELLSIISLLEAYIDFPEEEIPSTVLDEVRVKLSELTRLLATHVDDNRRGERLRNGLKLAIVGKPNVGKSSLLNFLARREVAIVSHVAGTTRDVIETHLDIGGYPIILTDTAGIRKHTEDIIEREGIKRAMEQIKVADIKILMIDASAADDDLKNYDFIDDSTIVVFNKIDLRHVDHRKYCEYEVVPVSIKSGVGLDNLLKVIEHKASDISRPSDGPSITRIRHRQCAMDGLQALTNCNIHGDLVLATEDIRIAMRSLEMMTGKICVDEILGEIFANFCIGK